MDPIALVVIGVVVAGVAWFTLFRNNDTTEFSDPTPVAPPTKPVSTVKHPAKKPEPAVKTLPGNAALNSLTKAKLEELGRDMGVELDKRKTKANMIADLKKAVK